MTKNIFLYGGCTKEEYFWFINERHRIYCNRNKGNAKPWTDDEILQSYKFTNIFRQLDTGTLVLHEMLNVRKKINPKILIHTIIWYRLFNLADHGIYFRDKGFLPGPTDLKEYMDGKNKRAERIFTSAHMTTGQLGRDKVDTYIDAMQMAWDSRETIARIIKNNNSMEDTFEYLKTLMMIGPFVAYEIVCDFRWVPLLNKAKDINTWANVGPGAARGLRRLGMPATLDSMLELLKISRRYIGGHVKTCTWPFELREIEHSLCEFDKYMRSLKDGGRPRQKYDGGGE